MHGRARGQILFGLCVLPPVALAVLLSAVCWGGCSSDDGSSSSKSGSDAAAELEPGQPIEEEPEYDAGAGLEPAARGTAGVDIAGDTGSGVEGGGRGVENLLLLGFDAWGRIPGRTDAILVLSLRRSTSDIAVISVPRDLWVEIPGYEPGRINKVARVGEIGKVPGGGLELMRRVVERELGIELDAVVASDFAGFERAIDVLGGVEVDVACPIRDSFLVNRSGSERETLSLAAGRQLLDGRTALLYARSRHGRTDLDRARRQQAVLLGVERRLRRLDAILRLPALWSELSVHLRTDLDLSAALRLARFAVAAGAGMVHGVVLRPPVVRSWRTPDGKAVLVLDREKLDEALKGVFEAPAPGLRSRPTCPAPDVALHWRERLRETKARRAARRAGDAGAEPPTAR
ncbi:MAG: LCP family protein [Polyangia bacterium]